MNRSKLFASKRTGKALQTMSRIWSPWKRTLKAASKDIKDLLPCIESSGLLEIRASYSPSSRGHQEGRRIRALGPSPSGDHSLLVTVPIMQTLSKKRRRGWPGAAVVPSPRCADDGKAEGLGEFASLLFTLSDLIRLHSGKPTRNVRVPSTDQEGLSAWA